MNDRTRTEIEAAVFRKLLGHLRANPGVQNIDLMNLAYFCRNCFAKWYRGEAAAKGIEMSYDEAREIIYGMPYLEYKDKYQEETTAEQLALFEEAKKKAIE